MTRDILNKAMLCFIAHNIVTVSPSQASEPLDALVQSSCIDCHDESTDTKLDLTALAYEFTDPTNYRKWVRVYERIERGEMPPTSAKQPDSILKMTAVSFLKNELRNANLKSQEKFGRVPSRRLSRLEFEYTLHDLLGIGGSLARQLPPENGAAAFDVVAEKQEMSSVHVRGLLTAADLALDEAIALGHKPNMQERVIDYFNSPYIQMWVDRPVRRGGGTVFKTDTDVVTFRGENYVYRTDANGYSPPIAGMYRIRLTAAPHQQRSSITVSLKRQNDQQGESELFAAWDLGNEDYRTVSTLKYLRPDDYIYVSADELEPAPDGKVIYNVQPAKEYKGEGVRIRRFSIEGPLESTWPPERTRSLFPGIRWQFRAPVQRGGRAFHPVLSKEPAEHIRDSINALGRKAYGRDLTPDEVDVLLQLAMPHLEADRDFIDCARIPLRAILVSPELLFHSGKAGQLDGIELAKRLSYFLWRTLPDDELLDLAKKGQLTESKVLHAQAERMLGHPNVDRFLVDFLDQWLELSRIDETTPDVYLYPEYDDVLRRSMLAETREFFAHLIEDNLTVANLIESDFTFLNRKLAEHYKIKGMKNINGEAMRKVILEPGSVRGGLLTHASIAKITANGTVTTPVKRGNFVLSTLLGLPPSPPPPGVGSIEPDTRGATTIREVLTKHQQIETCAVCHKRIDPPGFALESFDPVGNFRSQYRNSKGVTREINAGLRFLHVDYELGQAVDPSGITEDGQKFADIRDFKTHLLRSTEQVARNVASQLITFATGGEIDFADSEVIEQILLATKDDGYPMRSLIHQVIASRIFRNR